MLRNSHSKKLDFLLPGVWVVAWLFFWAYIFDDDVKWMGQWWPLALIFTALAVSIAAFVVGLRQDARREAAKKDHA